MVNSAKVNEAAERFAKSTFDSYWTVVDHAVGLQERNARFTQELVESSIQEMRQQAESNLAMTQTLAEWAEKQSGVFRTLVEEWVDAYTNFLCAPFFYSQEGLQSVTPEGVGSGGRENSLPIEDYDRQTVAEISRRLTGLSSGEIERLKDYEQRNKNRRTLLERLDGALI